MSSLAPAVSLSPLVQLGTGKPAELNYNLPQSSCFDASGSLTIAIPKDFWKEKHYQKPKVNFFTEVQSLTPTELGNALEGAAVSSARHPWTAEVIRKQKRYNATQISNAKGKGKDDFKGGSDPKGDIKGDTGSPKDDFKNDVGDPITHEQIGAQVAAGMQPLYATNLFGEQEVTFQPEPIQPDPRLVICFHYKVCSYLGDYGAGGTVKTFSLLPGEKHVISIKTYRQVESTRKKAENILDSFSESSTRDLERFVEEQTKDDYQKELNLVNQVGWTQSHVGNWQVGGGVTLTVPIKGVDLGINANGSGGATNSTSTTNNVTGSINTNIQNMVSLLDRSIDHHVAQSSAVRNVTVNTETSEIYKEGEETSTTRTLENINLSRVLNFVFRQLLQEYLTVIYLDQVSFIYCNGYAETRQVAGLDGLLGLLRDMFKDETRVQQVREAIMAHLCHITDHEGVQHSFVEHVQEEVTQCCGHGDFHRTRDYCRKRRGLSQTWKGITVPGIILSVRSRILRTDSVITEALLGHGEALDCYNQKLQEAATQKAQLDVQRAALENAKLEQAMRIIDLIDDPKLKAELYKKVFGDCCAVPQTGGGCGCAGSGGCGCGGGSGKATLQ